MSDEEAHDAFRLIRWAETQGEAVCPKCACGVTYKITTRRLWKCKACHHQFSVTSGTIVKGGPKSGRCGGAKAVHWLQAA